jgi:uncharacterized protein (TIGR03032 family)
VPGNIECSADFGFAEWISAYNGCLAITTYQAKKLMLVAWDGTQVTVLPRYFDRPMGCSAAPAANGQPAKLALATRYAVRLFADSPQLAVDYLPKEPGRHDALFLPRMTYHTGNLAAHDLAFGAAGLWVVNTRFSCLARVSDSFSFIPAWKPPFVSDVVPEDRCHLNGLALVDGSPGYVTCLGEVDVAGGWRETKATGGVVVDVRTGWVLARGMAMPHSPRWHAEKLWVLNSGAGELLAIDPASGRGGVVCALPGYLRGMALEGPFALVGLSQIREQHIFGGLPVLNRFPRLLCGVAVIDLRTGNRIGLLEITAGCTELFEVGLVPGTRRPMLVDAEREESRSAFTAPTFSFWVRPDTTPDTAG